MNNERILANIKAKKLSLVDLQEVAAAGSTTNSVCASGTHTGQQTDGVTADLVLDL